MKLKYEKKIKKFFFSVIFWVIVKRNDIRNVITNRTYESQDSRLVDNLGWLRDTYRLEMVSQMNNNNSKISEGMSQEALYITISKYRPEMVKQMKNINRTISKGTYQKLLDCYIKIQRDNTGSKSNSFFKSNSSVNNYKLDFKCNPFSKRLMSIRYSFIDFQNSIHTVFYQNFGSPYYKFQTGFKCKPSKYNTGFKANSSNNHYKMKLKCNPFSKRLTFCTSKQFTKIWFSIVKNDSSNKYNSIAKDIMDADCTQHNQLSIINRCEINTTKQFINRCEINTTKQFIYTVFYHKFGFPYSIQFRTISFRTCKLALVPTYNYLLKVILVQNILFR